MMITIVVNKLLLPMECCPLALTANTLFERLFVLLMAAHLQYVCSACQSAIRDHVVLECDRRHFHPACLKCQLCRSTPSSGGQQKLYSFNGLLLCKDDYTQLKSACHVCRQRIEPQDYRFSIQSIRQSVHMSCMSCATCHRALEAGDRYVVSQADQRLLCQKCHSQMNLMMTSQTPPPQQTTDGRQQPPQTTGGSRRGRKKATQSALNH